MFFVRPTCSLHRYTGAECSLNINSVKEVCSSRLIYTHTLLSQTESKFELWSVTENNTLSSIALLDCLIKPVGLFEAYCMLLLLFLLFLSNCYNLPQHVLQPILAVGQIVTSSFSYFAKRF